MRLLVFVLGVFTAVGYIEKPTEAEQNHPWCINNPDESPQCRYATLEQCLADRLGRARLVHLVHTRRHRKHVHQAGPRGAKLQRLAQKPQQLRVRRASRKRDGICGGVIRSCARG
jgi:hypothetical protein